MLEKMTRGIQRRCGALASDIRCLLILHTCPITQLLKLKHAYNPVLQRFYECIQKRCLDPNTPIPKLDERIEKYVNPDSTLFNRAKRPLEGFKDRCPLKRVGMCCSGGGNKFAKSINREGASTRKNILERSNR